MIKDDKGKIIKIEIAESVDSSGNKGIISRVIEFDKGAYFGYNGSPYYGGIMDFNFYNAGSQRDILAEKRRKKNENM